MMDGLMATRLAITGIAIAVWGYGLQSDNATVRLVGMGLLAVSLILRFARRFIRKEPPAQQ